MLSEDFTEVYLPHQFCSSECPVQTFSEPYKSEKLEPGKEKMKKSQFTEVLVTLSEKMPGTMEPFSSPAAVLQRHQPL